MPVDVAKGLVKSFLELKPGVLCLLPWQLIQYLQHLGNEQQLQTNSQTQDYYYLNQSETHSNSFGQFLYLQVHLSLMVRVPDGHVICCLPQQRLPMVSVRYHHHPSVAPATEK
jgi:hypothetical protein